MSLIEIDWMADKKSFSFDDEVEDDEWVSSKIKGYTFEDDDESPFQELAKYQTQSLAANSLGSGGGNSKEDNELVISFDSAPGTSSGTARVITDRVRAATAAYAARLDRQERGLSISDVLSDSSSSQVNSTVVSNDPKTLRAELAQVKRQVEKIHAARFTPLHPKETVRNIFFGQPYSLELYKSFNDKVELVNEAIELGDGNAILAVSLFSRSLFENYVHSNLFILFIGCTIPQTNIVSFQTPRNLSYSTNCCQPSCGLPA